MLELTWVTVLILIISGVIVGFINTLAGGGTVISISVFMFLGLPPLVANGTNRVPIVFQNLASAYLYHKKKMVDWKKGFQLSIPIIFGNIVGAIFADYLPSKYFSYIFAGVVVLFGLSLLFDPKRWLKENPTLQHKPTPTIHYLIYFIIGFYAGFVHVGVGYFYIGALVLLGGYDLMKANVMKILFVLFSVPFGLSIYAIQGNVHWEYGLIHAIGNVIGAYIGVHYAVKKGGTFVRYIILALVLIVVLQMLDVITTESIIKLLSSGK